MFKANLTSTNSNTDLKYDEYAKNTKGYSGADIRSACREAAMWPVRRLMDQLETLELDTTKTQEEIEQEAHLDLITYNDVQLALNSTRPTAQVFLDKYKTWQADFGAS
ncbi:MAG: hypothetical protein EZS28_034709 [Streblomastix strix]|uniref:AAA ATPase AAA+ lid domain-containing protein n=1 Tax=Streblomastix strix TaxID=222440 RepID=A0A5J4UJI3_9EUKA|nr:MAG: hypothetical protein EZS28_034709 [Streblomastix strix]